MYAILEIVSVICAISGATLVTSIDSKMRLIGFQVFMIGAFSSAAVFLHANLNAMLIQSLVMMCINIRGIHNNLIRGNNNEDTNLRFRN